MSWSRVLRRRRASARPHGQHLPGPPSAPLRLLLFSVALLPAALVGEQAQAAPEQEPIGEVIVKFRHGVAAAEARRRRARPRRVASSGRCRVGARAALVRLAGGVEAAGGAAAAVRARSARRVGRAERPTARAAAVPDDQLPSR